MLLPARRRFKLSAFLAVLLFIGITFTLVPEFMNTSLKRLTSFRAHLFSVPTPFAQANIASRTTQLDKIGSAISTTRPLTTSATMSDYKNEVDAAIKDNFVMVFSKSYCPYCSATKKLLSEVTKSLPNEKKYKVIELDQRDDGSDIQQYLKSKNGQGTVPHVYIGEEFIGGNSDLQALKGSKLEQKLKA